VVFPPLATPNEVISKVSLTPNKAKVTKRSMCFAVDDQFCFNLHFRTHPFLMLFPAVASVGFVAIVELYS
jgi:hypothetical protein